MRILFVLICFICVVSGCEPEAVKNAFFVNVESMNGDQTSHAEQITRNITSSLVEGSSINVNVIGYTVKEIVSFVKSSDDSSWIEKIDFDKNTGMNNDFINSPAMDEKLTSIFPYSLYKKEAEFVVAIVTDKTKLHSVSPLLKKKKTIVIVLGSEIPKIFEDMASRKDYLFLVKGIEDLEEVINKVKERIACDSNQYCDTDSYSLVKESKCRSCETPCARRTDVCTQRCLFTILQPKTSTERNAAQINEVTSITTKNRDNVEEKQDDNKKLFIWFVIGAVIVIALLPVVVCCLRRKMKKHVLTPGNSDETIPKEYELKEIKTDKFPVPVTDEADKPLVDQHADDVNGPDGGVDEEPVPMEDEEAIIMKFKNKREVDTNLYGDRDHYINIRGENYRNK